MTGGADTMTGPMRLLKTAHIVPVLTIADVAHAVPLARALVAGGVRTLEITLRTPAGLPAAALIQKEVSDAIVGLGTVLTRADLERCVSSGFAFAFSPGASPALLDAAAMMGLDFVPGVQTASEIMACLERGFDVMKFFPATQAGGIPTLKALAGPFPHVKFCPTGGIGEDEAATWLALPNVLAVGGSWLAPKELVEGDDWAAITVLARRSIEMLGA